MDTFRRSGPLWVVLILFSLYKFNFSGLKYGPCIVNSTSSISILYDYNSGIWDSYEIWHKWHQYSFSLVDSCIGIFCAHCINFQLFVQNFLLLTISKEFQRSLIQRCYLQEVLVQYFFQIHLYELIKLWQIFIFSVCHKNKLVHCMRSLINFALDLMQMHMSPSNL